MSYFTQMGLECINNAFGVVYFNGTMRSIVAAIDKIKNDNEGARVIKVATSTIKIFNEKSAIMDACIIFDLPEIVTYATRDKSSKKKKKVQITEPIRLFCKENNIDCFNYSKGTVFFYGCVEHISTAITMIEDANKNLKIKYLQPVTVSIKEEKEIGNVFAIFEDNDIVEKNYANDEIVEITKSIRLYCGNHNVKIDDNGKGLVCMTGSMRHVSATISKIREANKGSVKDLQTKTISTGIDKETGRDIAIVNANVIFSYWCKKQINKNTMLRFYQHLFLNYQKQIYLSIQSNTYINFLPSNNQQLILLHQFLHF